MDVDGWLYMCMVEEKEEEDKCECDARVSEFWPTASLPSFGNVTHTCTAAATVPTSSASSSPPHNNGQQGGKKNKRGGGGKGK